MEELITILLGGESIYAYLAVQILGMIGFISMSMVNYYYREDKTIPWSLKKWNTENWPLVILVIITMYIGLRWQADIVDGINQHTNDFSFIKDKWFWFVVGGFLFRGIVHQANKYVKKITSKEVE